MTPEREQPEPDHLSFEEVISLAIDIMFKDGNHVPTVFMETSNSIVVGRIPDMPPTHGERVELMHFLGQTSAESGKVDQLHQVFMVSEGWMSEPSENKPSDIRPSQDPDRKEVLIISGIHVKEQKKRLEVLEILRDSNQQVIGLKEFLPGEEKKDEKIEIPLLDAFVQGFQMAFRAKFS